MPSSRAAFFMDTHLLNAPFPISVTVPGITISVIPVELNAAPPIFVKPALSVTFSSVLTPSKAPPIVLTPVRSTSTTAVPLNE